MGKIRTKEIKELFEDAKNLIDTYLERYKLKAIEKAAKLIADVLSNTVVILCILIAFLAASVTLAFYFSALLGSYTKGFACAALFYFLVAILVGVMKDKYIEKWIASMAVKRYFDKHCVEDEDCD